MRGGRIDPDRPALAASAASPCLACGACCAYSAEWPRFTLESDEAIARIPPALVNEAQSGMRCEGDRCAALDGQIGLATRCTIYALRPDVCRACEPGDDACSMARERSQTSVLTGSRMAMIAFITFSIRPRSSGVKGSSRSKS